MKRKAILMMGQSNMAGRGFVGDVPVILNEKIEMLRNGHWQLMVEPINYDRPVAGVGLASSFADKWVQTHPDTTIGLIPCAEGGSSIDEWAIGSELLENTLSQANLALKDSELLAIFWHQGESDSHSDRHSTYYQKLEQLLITVKKELHQPNIPVIIGELPAFLGKTGFGLMSPEYEKINAVLKDFCSKHNHTYFVSAKELTANPDGIHIDAHSQRRFGLRYFEALAQQQDILAPLADEDGQLKDLYNRPLSVNEKMYQLSTKMALGNCTYPEFEAAVKDLLSTER